MQHKYTKISIIGQHFVALHLFDCVLLEYVLNVLLAEGLPASIIEHRSGMSIQRLGYKLICVFTNLLDWYPRSHSQYVSLFVVFVNPIKKLTLLADSQYSYVVIAQLVTWNNCRASGKMFPESPMLHTKSCSSTL